MEKPPGEGAPAAFGSALRDRAGGDRPGRGRIGGQAFSSSPFSQEKTKPPSAPPMIGAAQNSHSCCRARPPSTRAGPVDRAGLTDVLVIGIEIRWMRVRHRH